MTSRAGESTPSFGAARRAPRRRPGRVLVVGGDERLAADVAVGTQRAVVAVTTPYDALGELVTAGLLAAPEAIVVREAGLDSDARGFADAVRRLDPSVRLVLVREGGYDDGAATAVTGSLADLDFDDVLARGDVATSLDAAIAGALEPPGPRHRPRRAEALVAGRGTVPEGAASSGEASTPTPHAASTASASPSGASAAANVIEPALPMARPLGDVDLVDRLLHDPDAFRATALRLIAQESGFDDVRLFLVSAAPRVANTCVTPVKAPPPAPPSSRSPARGPIDAIAAPAGPAAFGYLASARAGGEAALRPWAAWLGAWLALEARGRQLHDFAYGDPLTGACNRRYFDAFLPAVLADARNRRQCVTLLVFDIDDFKHYNDRHGHAAGDEILVETVRLLTSVIRPHDKVCRIGGDEFVVVFHDPAGQRQPGSSHPDDIQAIARRFQRQICGHRFPKLAAEAPGTLTISGGLATYPWDGSDAASLLEAADRNALAAKRAGKNAITFGPGAGDVCRGVTS